MNYLMLNLLALALTPIFFAMLKIIKIQAQILVYAATVSQLVVLKLIQSANQHIQPTQYRGVPLCYTLRYWSADAKRYFSS